MIPKLVRVSEFKTNIDSLEIPQFEKDLHRTYFDFEFFT